MRFFLLPADGLVGADHGAETTESASIELLQPAVCASFRPVQLGHHYTSPVKCFSGPEDPVRADKRAEVAPLAPIFINHQFHVYIPWLQCEPFHELFLCMRIYFCIQIASVGIYADDERNAFEFYYPDRLGHSEIFKIDSFKTHL
jgi:hypothetical protein